MARALPEPDLLTEPYWKRVAEGVFALPRCGDCGRWHFYPRDACPSCGSGRIAWAEASGRGEIYSFSVVHRAPAAEFKADVPYVLAIVKTQEGPRLFTRIVGVAHEDVRIGMPVRVKLARPGEEPALPVFEPA